MSDIEVMVGRDEMGVQIKATDQALFGVDCFAGC